MKNNFSLWCHCLSLSECHCIILPLYVVYLINDLKMKMPLWYKKLQTKALTCEEESKHQDGYILNLSLISEEMLRKSLSMNAKYKQKVFY